MITKLFAVNSIRYFCDTREEQGKTLKQLLETESITKITFGVQKRLSKKGEFYIKLNENASQRAFGEIPVTIRSHSIFQKSIH